MLKPGGVGEYYLDGRLIKVVHTSKCYHCQHTTEFPSLKVMLEHVDICRGCMCLICLQCVGKLCRPFEKEAERQEKEYRLKAALEREVWGCYAVR